MNIELDKLVARVEQRTSRDGADTFLSALIESERVQNLIDSANATMKQRKESISEVLFSLAKGECSKFGDNAQQEFVSRCAKAEKEFKDAKEGRVIPKQWSQAKSNIKAALGKDMDLSEYSTESAMRKALTEKRKAEREAAAEGGAVESAGLDKGDAEVYGEMLATVLNKYEGRIHREEAYDMVREFVDKLDAMVDAPVNTVEGEAVRVAH